MVIPTQGSESKGVSGMSWITTGFKFLPLIVEAVRSVEKIVKKKAETKEPRYEHGKHKQDSALH